jgi:hypothetical protein
MAFVDVALLDVYNSDIVIDQRQLVKDLLNCEDILLNFVGSIGTLDAFLLLGTWLEHSQ